MFQYRSNLNPRPLAKSLYQLLVIVNEWNGPSFLFKWVRKVERNLLSCNIKRYKSANERELPLINANVGCGPAAPCVCLNLGQVFLTGGGCLGFVFGG